MIDGTHDGVIGSGRQTAAETAPWGPGQRTCCILHYVFEGRGYFCRGGQRYTLTAGQTFLIRPYEEVEYGPEPDDPWGYVWINFVGDAYVRLLDRIDARDGCLVPPLPPESILPFFSLMPTFEGRPERQHTADHLGLTILGVYADAFPPPGERSRSAACFGSACLLIRAIIAPPSASIRCVRRSMSAAPRCTAASSAAAACPPALTSAATASPAPQSCSRTARPSKWPPYPAAFRISCISPRRSAPPPACPPASTAKALRQPTRRKYRMKNERISHIL